MFLCAEKKCCKLGAKTKVYVNVFVQCENCVNCFWNLIFFFTTDLALLSSSIITLSVDTHSFFLKSMKHNRGYRLYSVHSLIKHLVATIPTTQLNHLTTDSLVKERCVMLVAANVASASLKQRCEAGYGNFS